MRKIQFEKAEYQDWLDAIPKALADKISKFEISPFSHYSKTKSYDNVGIPSTIDKTWFLVQSVEVSKVENLNKTILIFLNQGINSLHLIIKEYFTVKEWEEVFSDIQLSFISIHLDGEIEGIHSFLKYFNHKNVQTRLSIPYDLRNEFKHSGLIIRLSAHGSDEQELFEIIQHTDEILKINNEKDIIITLEFTLDYLKNIARVYALKILLLHLYESHELPYNSQLTIIGYNKIDKDIDFEHYCIKSTVECASAMNAGIKGFKIQTANFENFESAFTDRILQNIHHICLEEGKLDKVKNPLNGSYYIEELANKMGQKIWERFLKIKDQE